MNIKRYIIHKLLRHLFNTVSSDDILWEDKQGKWHIGEDVLTREDMHTLKTEAATLQNMQLYKLLMKRSRYLANDALFNRSTTEDDLIFPKGILWIVKEWEDVISKLSK